MIERRAQGRSTEALPAVARSETVEPRDPQTYEIIGAAMEVHRELGAGFREAVYHEALVIEFTRRSIPFDSETPLPVLYRGEPLACGYQCDFVCFGQIIVELKALDLLTTREQAQLLNYLKATALRRGLLINFGAPRLETKRMVV